MSLCSGFVCCSGGEAFAKEEREHQDDDDDVQCGTRRPVKMQDPKLPSAEGISEHSLAHLPYRPWCPHCVRGKGKSMPHG